MIHNYGHGKQQFTTKSLELVNPMPFHPIKDEYNLTQAKEKYRHDSNRPVVKLGHNIYMDTTTFSHLDANQIE